MAYVNIDGVHVVRACLFEVCGACPPPANSRGKRGCQRAVVNAPQIDYDCVGVCNACVRGVCSCVCVRACVCVCVCVCVVCVFRLM